MSSKYFFLFYAIFDQITINFIGTFSLSDLYTLILFVYYLYFGRISWHIKRNKDIASITKLYLILLSIIFITEILVGNQVSNIAKGLAIPIMSYAKLLFLWIVLGKKPSSIKWYLVGLIIGSVLFLDPEKEEGIGDLLSGEKFTFFKYTVAPAILNSLVAISLFKFRIVKKMHIVFIGVGVFDIVFGARSTGLMTMMTGFIAYIINSTNKRITKKQILQWTIISIVVLYPLYIVYVNAVLSGDIVSGNSHDQLTRLENPYNPIYALLSGRTESPASISAILDSPWIGWGAWAEDPGFKYHQIAMAFQGEMLDINRVDKNLIPAHSVLLQQGVHNGIFALFIMGAILYFFIKRGGMGIYKNSPFLYLLIFCISQLIWNGLFSPLSHFRNAFPFYFFCCLYAYRQKNNTLFI